MEEKKFYTKINMKHCVGKEREYTGVTIELLCQKAEKRYTGDGKKVMSFRAPISNAGRYIGSMCGIAPYEDSAGTCWARVAFWNSMADRFDAYVQKNPKSVIIVTGAIKVKETKGKDGKTYRDVEINADDFWRVRTLDGKEHAASGYEKESNESFGGFTELPDSDSSELPF